MHKLLVHCYITGNCVGYKQLDSRCNHYKTNVFQSGFFHKIICLPLKEIISCKLITTDLASYNSIYLFFKIYLFILQNIFDVTIFQLKYLIHTIFLTGCTKFIIRHKALIFNPILCGGCAFH